MRPMDVLYLLYNDDLMSQTNLDQMSREITEMWYVCHMLAILVIFFQAKFESIQGCNPEEIHLTSVGFT